MLKTNQKTILLLLILVTTGVFVAHAQGSMFSTGDIENGAKTGALTVLKIIKWIFMLASGGLILMIALDYFKEGQSVKWKWVSLVVCSALFLLLNMITIS